MQNVSEPHEWITRMVCVCMYGVCVTLLQLLKQKVKWNNKKNMIDKTVWDKR